MNYEQELQELDKMITIHTNNNYCDSVSGLILSRLLDLARKMQEEIQDLHTSINAYDDFKCYLIAELARTKQNWIPCSERLPETTEDLDFLITVRANPGKEFWSVGTWLAKEKRWFAYRKECVIAWMPLPELYGCER
jgi:hypothetical protein